ncbi:winged helix-turn-helix transcriptional regulator [Ligilactobacillus ruminis]|uniref:winged helix-turn-helix transcriptional regulator n=1 Tax=Ligilactobacillus ruminis TaxID=1623 RepID=UPI0002EDEB3E|nr:winged helix-turn-helix transcriptional regulator [Ligilactobacillus ruminis]
MNKHKSDILELLLKDSKLTQRQISERCQKFLKIIKKRQPNRLSLFYQQTFF